MEVFRAVFLSPLHLAREIERVPAIRSPQKKITPVPERKSFSGSFFGWQKVGERALIILVSALAQTLIVFPRL